MDEKEATETNCQMAGTICLQSGWGAVNVLCSACPARRDCTEKIAVA